MKGPDRAVTEPVRGERGVSEIMPEGFESVPLIAGDEVTFPWTASITIWPLLGPPGSA